MWEARVQLVGLGLLVSAMLVALVAVGISPRFAFVVQDDEVPWIASPDPISTGVVSAPFSALHQVEFARTLSLDPGAGPLRIRLQALRGFELELDGRRLAARAWDEGSWRRPIELVLPAPAAGEQRLVVRVRNPTGPPLLRLAGKGAGVRFDTGTGFEASRDGGPPRPSRRADDTLRAPAALTVPTVGRSLAAIGQPLLALAVGAVLLAVGLAQPRAAALRRHLWPAALLAVGALWVGVCAGTAVRLPAHAGFDGPDHLAYVHTVLEERALPLADEGPQTYHPPLFYAASALLLALLPDAPERVVLRILPILAGLAQIAIAWALARRLYPGDVPRVTATTVAAGFLPLHLTMSSYLTNEPVHAALAAGAVLATTAWLLASQPTLRGALGIGLLAGLAILAKVSSLLLVPVLGAFLFARRWLGDRAPLARSLAPAVACVAGAALVSGWFFVRNQLRLGQALIGNWDVPGNPIAWWQHPGFHTPRYYLRFGESLGRPFFSAYESFWDGLYTTFWGDGLIGGVAAWASRHPLWDYDFMAAVYALALPATALGLLGFSVLARASFRDGDLRRRIALAFLTTVVFVNVFAALYMTLVLPAYSMAKASYVASGAPVMALALAEGFVLADRFLGGSVGSASAGPGRRWARYALHAWGATLLGAIALAFAL